MAKRSDDDSQPVSGPLAAEPGDRTAQGSARSLGFTWGAWWIALMAFWVMLDDSFRPDELIAGAVAAALAASLATVVAGQAGEPARVRLAWARDPATLRRALTLPGEVIRDTLVVYRELARTLLRGTPPASYYALVPVRYGGDGPHDSTRRVLLTWVASLAPNTFAVSLDPERGQLVHHLTAPAGSAAQQERPEDAARGGEDKP